MSDPVDEEAYANNYYYFQRSLKILSQDAEAQCQAMDHFNVAWELRDEATNNGRAVLATVGAQLSDLEKDQIRRLVENVADVPDAVVNVPNSREAHIRAMSDPHWIPLRAQAKELIALMSAESERVHAVLYGKPS